VRPARALAMLAIASLGPLGAEARAEAAEPAGADSPGACAGLDEAARWRFNHQPTTEADVYRSMGEGIGDEIIGRFIAFVPSLGLELERSSPSPGLAIFWTATLPFGPVTACRFSRGGNLYVLRPLRLVIEPGILVRKPFCAFLRPGLRAIWHRSAWPLGLGAGIGSTLFVSDADRGSASISPELLVHYGRCCAPLYFLLSIRADRFFPRRQPDAVTASLGFAYF